jgi:DNA-binding MarR family transcriptional regulator
VLYLLSGGPRSQRELAEASGVTEQTMSRILVRLERTAYIERRPHRTDRRRHEVVLTEEGRQTLREAGDPRVAEQMSIRGLSQEQVASLREILGVMLAQRPRDTDHTLDDETGRPDEPSPEQG